MTKTSISKISKDYQKKYLASFFGKKYGEFVYSGTMALETALYCAEINEGDYVLIPNNICYRILLCIIRLKAIPIIITPINGWIITEKEISKAIEKFPIKALILVHNLGLPVNVKGIRKIVGEKIIIIEDASQAWKIRSKGNNIGQNSDHVITSFGLSKPLSFGIGGAIFCNNKNFIELIDNYDKNSRLSDIPLLPYALPKTFNIDIKKLIKTANKITRHQQLIAIFLLKNLDCKKINFWQPELNDQPTWHRFPIWTSEKSVYEKIKRVADECQIDYEIPHKISLNKTPLAINNFAISMGNINKNLYYFLIKTKNNSLKKITKFIKLLQ
ncbi:MAG: DegT/DnrJ/EryC1/StrS family aminotransferase [Candidatus Shapirobacteria bacterium]